jgi:hypothetical protein
VGKGNRRKSNKMLQRKAQAAFKTRLARRKAGEKPQLSIKKAAPPPADAADDDDDDS